MAGMVTTNHYHMDEAVDEPLCFGWIESKAKPPDNNRYMQFFSKRKPGGGWSKINKDNIRKLIEEGRMCQAGLDAIAVVLRMPIATGEVTMGFFSR